MEPGQTSNIAELSPQYILWLAILATTGLAFCWGAFWWAVTRRGENIRGILASPGFFRTVVVMGVIAAAAVLSLAGRLPSNITGAILSGIVGYVLGQLSGHSHQDGNEHPESSK
jgi:hypothetical protein